MAAGDVKYIGDVKHVEGADGKFRPSSSPINVTDTQDPLVTMARDWAKSLRRPASPTPTPIPREKTLGGKIGFPE